MATAEEVSRLLKYRSHGGHGWPWSPLSVERHAGEDEVKRSYRQLVLLVHPDKTANEVPQEDASEAFRILSSAFKVAIELARNRATYGAGGGLSQDLTDFSFRQDGAMGLTLPAAVKRPLVVDMRGHILMWKQRSVHLKKRCCVTYEHKRL
eukprot:gene5033-6134_t